MTLCKLDSDMKQVLRNNLKEIWHKSKEIVQLLDSKDKCLLCEITRIKELALELDANASFFHFQSSLFPDVDGMEEISRALTALSVKRHGAIIVVEQNDSLDEYINACTITGTLVGARVSAPLLETIFYPGNPLHDGAVILRKGQIVSAGCVLPLSSKRYTREGRKIGTRHRAAVGISERTDAIGIVVSEETGIVSIVQRGVLRPIEINMCEHGKSFHTPKPQASNAEAHLQAYFSCRDQVKDESGKMTKI